MTTSQSQTDSSQMTYTEQTRVDTAIEARNSQAMISPDGRTVKVPSFRVNQRIAAGYRFAD
jgi:hypothetical protein